jgi:hypothetical protein
MKTILDRWSDVPAAGQASKAKIIGLAKPASEFGIVRGGQKLAALHPYLKTVESDVDGKPVVAKVKELPTDDSCAAGHCARTAARSTRCTSSK